MNTTMPKKILVVDNDYSVMQRFKVAFERYKVAVTGAQDLDSAQAKFLESDQEVVVVDIAFREVNGLALLQKWRELPDPAKRAISYVLLCPEKVSKSDLSLMTELLDVQTLTKPVNTISSLSVFSKAATIFQKQTRIENLRHSVLSSSTDATHLTEQVKDLRGKLQSLGTTGDEIILDLFAKHERWDDALSYVEACLARSPNNIRFLYQKALFLQKLGRSREALQMMEPLSASSPNNLQRLKDLGALYLDLKMPEKAIDTTQQIMKYSTLEQDMQYKMYSMLSEKGFEKEALEFAQRTMDPLRLIRYYNNLGITLTKDGKIEQAIREYTHALKVFPAFALNYKLYFNLGLCQTKIKTVAFYRDAEISFQKCLEINPDFEKARELLKKVQDSIVKLSRAAG